MHFPLGPAEAVGYTAALLVEGRRSSVVERILGKAEVVGSIPPGGTTFPQRLQSVGETPLPYFKPHTPTHDWHGNP